MTTAAIIVAAGRGLRAGGGVPKQWRSLAGRRVADWTIEQFRGQVDHIVLVLSDEDTPAWEEFRNSDLILASGGIRGSKGGFRTAKTLQVCWFQFAHGNNQS